MASKTGDDLKVDGDNALDATITVSETSGPTTEAPGTSQATTPHDPVTHIQEQIRRAQERKVLADLEEKPLPTRLPRAAKIEALKRTQRLLASKRKLSAPTATKPAEAGEEMSEEVKQALIADAELAAAEASGAVADIIEELEEAVGTGQGLPEHLLKRAEDFLTTNVTDEHMLDSAVIMVNELMQILAARLTQAMERVNYATAQHEQQAQLIDALYEAAAAEEAKLQRDATEITRLRELNDQLNDKIRALEAGRSSSSGGRHDRNGYPDPHPPGLPSHSFFEKFCPGGR